jgi:hypothetical protein
MEISPDGASLRPRSRFARFVNLPELQHVFRAFADVRTPEMLDLPRPRLEGGKPMVVACPMSAEQAALQQELVARYERPRTRNASAAEAITARIRWRSATRPTAEPIPEAENAAPTIEPNIVATYEEARVSAITAIPETSGGRDRSPPTATPSGPAASARLPGACHASNSEVRPPTQPVLNMT